MKKFDVVDLMASSYRVPKAGLPIREPDTVFYPVETSSRIYNHSDDKRFYVFATESETFICPFFFGIEKLLKENGFKKVDHYVLNVNFGSKMCPRYRNALDPWISNFNAIRNYCYETAKEVVCTNFSGNGTLLIPSTMSNITQVPISGVYIKELKNKFYPVISNVFPYITHYEYIGTYNLKRNEDDENYIYILHNKDGSFIARGSGSEMLSNILANRGYQFNPELFVPHFKDL